MAGQKEIEPRWKRCVRASDRNLGMALGQLYVDKTFGVEGNKARTVKMVQAIEQAMHSDIGQLPWMSDTTKQQAYLKLAAIVNNIGYPDTWRDYSTVVVVTRDDYAGNVENVRRRLRGPAPVQQDGEADRPQRLVDDPADGERVLPSTDERH